MFFRTNKQKEDKKVFSPTLNQSIVLTSFHFIGQIQEENIVFMTSMSISKANLHSNITMEYANLSKPDAYLLSCLLQKTLILLGSRSHCDKTKCYKLSLSAMLKDSTPIINRESTLESQEAHSVHQKSSLFKK
jgi:hypothetical protein